MEQSFERVGGFVILTPDMDCLLYTSMNKLMAQDDERIFCIAEAFRRGLADVEEIFERTKIDRWFLHKIYGIIEMEKILQTEEILSLIHISLSPGYRRQPGAVSLRCLSGGRRQKRRLPEGGRKIDGSGYAGL